MSGSTSHDETAAGTLRPMSWLGRFVGVPTGLLFGLSLLPLGVAFFIKWYPELLFPVIALDIVLVLVALGDLIATTGTVSVERGFAPVQAVGRAFPVTLRVRNDGRRALSIRVTDAQVAADAVGIPAQAKLAAGREHTAEYLLTVARRGQHEFGDMVVRWTSPLGLWERQRRYEVPGVVRVYPDFGRLRDAALSGRRTDERVPVRSRRRPGGENEFQRLRPYVPGDAYRHIDWKATARRGEFITREFGQESNQNLIFLLDCGRMMTAQSGSLTAFDHALNAAILLGQRALRHGDRVGLLAFDSKPRVWLAPRAGKRSAGRLIRGTYDLFPSTDEPDYSMAFRFLTQHVRRRSLVVLFTSVIDEVSADMSTQLVQALSSRHLPLAVWIRDAGLETVLYQPAERPVDVFVRAAAAELHGWRDRAFAGLRQRGALVVDGAPEEITAGLLDRYLEIKARRLL